LTGDLAAAAARIGAKRRELELRLEQLHNVATTPQDKLVGMRLVASCFFELLDHQGAFNDAAIARIAALEAPKRDTAPGVVL